jgi:glyoxylase-like metal-dependent hydrolase (beta-lactamase superfamily II)
VTLRLATPAGAAPTAIGFTDPGPDKSTCLFSGSTLFGGSII